MPKSFDRNGRGKEGQVTLAVATNRTKLADSIDYNYYALDASLGAVLKAIASRSYGNCKLQLLDTDGEIISTDRFESRQVWNEVAHFNASPICIPDCSQLPAEYWKRPDTKPSVLILSSVFLEPTMYTGTYVTPTLIFSRSLTLSLDELKSVKDAKVEITFDE